MRGLRAGLQVPGGSGARGNRAWLAAYLARGRERTSRQQAGMELRAAAGPGCAAARQQGRCVLRPPAVREPLPLPCWLCPPPCRAPALAEQAALCSEHPPQLRCVPVSTAPSLTVPPLQGTIPGHKHSYALDDHHTFQAGKWYEVCGNTGECGWCGGASTHHTAYESTRGVAAWPTGAQAAARRSCPGGVRRRAGRLPAACPPACTGCCADLARCLLLPMASHRSRLPRSCLPRAPPCSSPQFPRLPPSLAAAMVGDSWLGKHFEVIGERCNHYGLFACGPAPGAAAAPAADCGPGGACC